MNIKLITGELILTMKLLIFILFFCFSATQTTASGKNIKELRTYPFEVLIEKNEINTFKIPYSGNNRVIIEITQKPKHVKVLPYSEKMSIVCIVPENFCGEDLFYFRIYDGEVMSNISKCTIIAGQPEKKSVKQQITERLYRSRRV